MLLTDWMAIASVLLLAASILPGTLVFLMLTNKLAVSEGGARYIYGNAFWVGIASLVLALSTLVIAVSEGPSHYLTIPFVASVVLYGAILVWGFFMHTKLMFQPVREPRYLDTAAALVRFGGDEEVVGVIDPAGRPWAYIARLSRRPHVVYQPEGDNPFIMTHCILAHSSMAFAMNDRFNQPDITITAALANNMVFYDKNTQCSVIQMHNRSLDKSMPLNTLPTVSMSLATWTSLYPDSKVWYRDISWRDIFYLKMLARADVIDPKSPVMVYPLQNGLDQRLPMKINVMGVKIGEHSMTYPASLFDGSRDRVINDVVGGVPVAVVSTRNGDFVQVYDRRANGRELTFEFTGDGTLRDAETGSTWSETGKAVSGELQGSRLEAVPHYNKIFWYVWSDFNPGTPIYSDAG
ncbi:MAG: hypothetical protein APF78_06105 [Sphingomonadales bacterium BRH_c3]|nr:MAG: hypothetical protein APF78_06105 [Sphingomonadales bacterium BRH_c3]